MHLKLSKGHDFRLSNHPSQEIVDVSLNAKQIILHPSDYPYIKPKLLVKEGEQIKAGTDLATIDGNVRVILTKERLILNMIWS